METLRSLFTLFAFAAFIGIIAYAYAPRRKQRFEAQARSILEEGDE
jgi:cbb3-type cytochrome oxidase subunit 3